MEESERKSEEDKKETAQESGAKELPSSKKLSMKDKLPDNEIKPAKDEVPPDNKFKQANEQPSAEAPIRSHIASQFPMGKGGQDESGYMAAP